MEEESDFDVFLVSFGYFFAEQTREDHQMIILDPNEIIIFDDIGDILGKYKVCFSICIPDFFVKVSLSRMVMEEWPLY